MAKVVTGKVRFSYVNAFTPRARAEGQEPKYGITLLIPKTDKATLNKINAAIEETRLGSAEIFSGKIPANLKTSLHDGDGEMPNGGEYPPEAKGCMVLSASSRTKPGVVDRTSTLSSTRRSSTPAAMAGPRSTSTPTTPTATRASLPA